LTLGRTVKILGAAVPRPEVPGPSWAPLGEQGFAEIVRAYGRRVFNMALRSARDPSAAEDICQEVWLRVHRDLPRLKDVEALPVWLFRIASRVCIDAARRRRSLDCIDLQELESGPEATPEARAETAERLRLAWEALGALPVRQHLALYLRNVESLSYAQIAQALDCPVPAVETLLFRARRSFARRFSEIETSSGSRCGNARRVMAALVDGESTPVQRRMVAAHVADCAACRAQLSQMQGADAAYAAVPMAALPLSLAALAAPSAAPVASGLGSVFARLAMLLAGRAQVIAAVAVLTAGGAALEVHVPAGKASPGGGTPAPVASSAGGAPASAPIAAAATADRDGPQPKPGAAPSAGTTAFDGEGEVWAPDLAPAVSQGARGDTPAATTAATNAAPQAQGSDAPPPPSLVGAAAGLVDGVATGAGVLAGDLLRDGSGLVQGLLDGTSSLLQDPGVDGVAALGSSTVDGVALLSSDLLGDTSANLDTSIASASAAASALVGPVAPGLAEQTGQTLGAAGQGLTQVTETVQDLLGGTLQGVSGVLEGPTGGQGDASQGGGLLDKLLH